MDPIEQSLLCLSQTLCVWLVMYKHRCVPCSDGRMHNYMPSRCGRCTCAVSVTRVMQYLVQLVGFGAGCSYSEVCRLHGPSASGTREYTTTCALRFELVAFGGPRVSFAAFCFAAARRMPRAIFASFQRLVGAYRAGDLHRGMSWRGRYSSTVIGGILPRYLALSSSDISTSTVSGTCPVSLCAVNALTPARDNL